MLDELEQELGAVRTRVARTLHAANTSWQVVNDVFARGQEPSAHAPGPF